MFRFAVATRVRRASSEMHMRSRVPAFAAVSLAVLVGGMALGQISLFSGEVFQTANRPELVTTADFNRDGRADLVVSNPGSNKVSVLLGGTNSTFSQKVDLTLMRRVTRVSTGDLNCDGRADLAMADRFGNSVFRMIGNGDGTFGEQETYSVAAGPRDVAIGNFDGRHGNDVVTVSATTAQATVLLNRGGSLGFDRLGDFSVGSAPMRVLAADLNGDGLDDIVALNSSTDGPNNVAVLLNTGGGFGLATQYPVGLDAQDMAIADFNHDGAFDIIALTSNDPTANLPFAVSVLLNEVDSGTATGVFDTWPPVQVVGCPPTVDGATVTCSAQTLAAADYDNDGHVDFVAVFSTTPQAGGTPTAGVLLAYQGHGDGTFDLATNLTVGWGPKGIVAADFTGDGIADVAVAEESGNDIRIVGSEALPPPQCVAGNQCNSGFCVDGACCDSAMCPPGQFCNLPGSLGTCAALPVLPVGSTTALCAGDCDCDAHVTVDELLTGINIALGDVVTGACPAFDANGDQTVTVDEVLEATNSALAGCAATAVANR